MILAISLNPALDKNFFIDGFEPGKLYRVSEITISAGGKGINAARVAAQLGEQVCVTGFIAGNTGKYLKTLIEDLGIETAFIEVDGETRTNINIIDRSDGKETELLETGPTIKKQDVIAFMNVFSNLIPRAEVIICSGGLPNGLPPDFYTGIIRTAAAKGVKVVFDSSGNIFQHGVKASPWLVKPNLRELAQYAGGSIGGIEDIIEISRKMVKYCGINTAVISMGSEGAVLVDKDRVLRGWVPQVDVVNTIGSGDSMVAGFAAAIRRGYDADNMFRLGLACSVANTQFSIAGYVELPLIEKYSREIRIRPFES